MAGENHLMEQVKKQWERLDAEGHRILNNLLMTEAERIEWSVYCDRLTLLHIPAPALNTC